jgi:hypothetical protein
LAQAGGSPVKVGTKGLVAKIKFEAPIGGFLNEINGKYKLRVTELTLVHYGFGSGDTISKVAAGAF